MIYGKFISIEGGEGAGKSTAIKFIRDYLHANAINTILTREPGGTKLAEEIRQLLLHTTSDEVMLPETELLLMFAARAQHISHCILPALHAGQWVISDRYIDASYAYQGGGRDISLEMIKTLDSMIVGNIYPDLTILLDVPVGVGLDRAAARGLGKDRIEQEQADFFQRVRQAYLERANLDPQRIKVIDASLPIDVVNQRITLTLDTLLKRQ